MDDPNLLAKIQQQCMKDSEDWFPETANDLAYMTIALSGETGEFANVVKKVCRGSISTQEALPLLREELTDIFIYLMTLSQLMRLDLLSSYVHKRDKNIERFSNGQH